MSEISMQSRVYIQKTRQLYANISGNLMIGFGLALLLTTIQAPVIEGAWLWLATLACVSLSRLALLHHFSRHFDDSLAMARIYAQRFYLGVIASGVMWGSAGIILFPADALDHQVILLLALIAISSGSIATLSSNFKYAVTFILLTLLPIEFNIIRYTLDLAIAESILCLALIPLMIRTAYVLGRTGESMLQKEATIEAEALEAAKQKNLFLSVLENIPARISWKDKNRKFLGANRLFLHDLGMDDAESIIGQSEENLYKQNCAKIKMESESEARILNRSDRHLQYEELKTDASDNEKWFEVHKSAILNDEHEVDGILTIYHDISKRKHAELMMRLAATAFETHEAVTITDPGGIILSVNKAFTEVTGYSEEEVVGKTSRILSSGKHDITFYSQMWQSLICHGRWKGEVINRRKNGEEYTQQLTITAVVDDEGKLLSYVGVFSDISEKKELEMQLRQAQKMEAVGTLVSGIAHEFNNMLVGISGNIFLSRTMIDKESPAYPMLKTADEICFKAADMVKQLLTFAHKESDTQKLKHVDMSEWIKEGLRMAHSSIPASIQLRLKQNNPEALYINADTTQLQQVLINLLNNARDALEGIEQARIQVEVSSGEANRAFRQRHNNWGAYRYVCLSVRDNGSGIPADKLEKIFEPFFTTKEVGKGTGLGMPVIQGLVAKHHGCIEIDSTVGEGTTMKLYFPRISNTVQPIPKLQKDMQIPRGMGETILIADDEPEVLMVTATLLENLGYRVVKAGDGDEAVKKFRQQPKAFALVLLDMVMPLLNGPEAAQQIRKIRPDIPLLFHSGYSADELLAELATLDDYKFLSKPYRAAEISQVVHSLLTGHPEPGAKTEQRISDKEMA